MKKYGQKIAPTLLMVLVLTACAFAQSDAPAAAPVPPEIFTAKTVFIANGGANSGLFPSPFSGTPSRGYDEFYAAMKKWGHYQLIDSPQNAELVMELRLKAPAVPATRNGPDKPAGEVNPRPMFRLVIYDRATHYPLWTLTDSVPWALFQKSHDQNFDNAIDGLVTQLKQLQTQH